MAVTLCSFENFDRIRSVEPSIEIFEVSLFAECDSVAAFQLTIPILKMNGAELPCGSVMKVEPADSSYRDRNLLLSKMYGNTENPSIPEIVNMNTPKRHQDKLRV